MKILFFFQKTSTIINEDNGVQINYFIVVFVNFTLYAKQVYHTESYTLLLSKSLVPVSTSPKSHPNACHLELGNNLLINILFICCVLCVLFMQKVIHQHKLLPFLLGSGRVLGYRMGYSTNSWQFKKKFISYNLSLCT